METNKVPSRIHPLVAVAAVSVTLVSLAGVAAITGLLPSSHSSNIPATPPAAAQATTTASAPTAATEKASEESAETHHSTHVAQVHHAQPHTSYSSGTNTLAKADVCTSCGRIESVHAIQHEAKPSGLGVAAGAVLGGVLGNQVGNGNGRTLATIAGVVGGGYAGNEVEKRTHTTTTYQVRVRMEDGSVRTFPYAAQPSWSEGERVRVVDGKLEARG